MIGKPGLEDKAREYVLANDNLKGYKLLMHWSDMEKSKGVYDFSYLSDILSLAQSDGKKVVVEMQERYFGGWTPSPLPQYLDDPIYEGGRYKAPCGASLPKIWVPAVADRYIALLEETALRFDSHPALVGILFPETALPGCKEQPGYAPQKFAESIKRINTAAAAAFRTTPVVQWINWANNMSKTEQDELMDDVVLTQRNGIGGPDVWNTGGGAASMQMGRFYDKYRGVAHVFHDTQSSGYKQNNAQFVFDYAVDTLGVHILSWAPLKPPTNDIVWGIDDAIEVINAEKGRINTEPPENIVVCPE